MTTPFRHLYGHGAARIPLAGSAPRWTAGGSLGQALRPMLAVFVGCALVLLGLPSFLPDRDVSAYAPLELALEVVPPPASTPQEPSPTPEPRPTTAPPPEFNRLPAQPELPRLASLEPLPVAPELPRARIAPRASLPAIAPSRPRTDLRIASGPTPDALAAVSAPPAPKVGVPRAPEPRPVQTPKVTLATADAQRRAGLDDVPLGRLAACPKPGEEDALKQRVIASPRAGGACESAAGAYRFVEHRNLNAFLLLVRRSPDRPVANRCEELRFALDCLAQRPKEPNES